MKRKFIRSIALVVLLCALLSMSAQAATIGGATVKTMNTGLNLRAQASTSAGCLAIVPNGAFVLVEEQLPGWYKVCYNGMAGYVSADYLSFSESLDGTYTFTGAVTTGSNVNLRALPGTDSARLKCINPAGSALTVIGVSGAWLHVRDAVGTEGYIRSDYVRYQNGETKSEGEKIVATALQYQGYRYKWAGSDPSTGFDCSGFVNYVYKLYGYSMERTAQNIYNTNGSAVSKEDLQPGDLVFFGWGAGSITHVGLYIGDGQFIHASTSSTGVIISELDSKYYTQKYVGAKRLIEG